MGCLVFIFFVYTCIIKQYTFTNTPKKDSVDYQVKIVTKLVLQVYFITSRIYVFCYKQFITSKVKADISKYDNKLFNMINKK